MSSVTIKWKLSEEVQKVQFVATGEKPDENYSLVIDLTTLTSEERLPLIEASGVYGSFDLTRLPEFDATREDFQKPAFLSQTLYYDSEPTMPQVLAHIEAVQAAKAIIEKAIAEKKAQERREQERLSALYDKYLPQVRNLIEARDYEALGKLPPGLSISGKVFTFRARGDSLHKMTSDARREIAKERRGEAKSTWIREHGSAHLRRAFEAGYDCQRRYVIERAAMEAPGFTVDFNDAAQWSDRPFPSESALNLTDSIATLGDALVVWLTTPAKAEVASEYDYDYHDFNPREAVVIRSYLDKYDLVSN